MKQILDIVCQNVQKNNQKNIKGLIRKIYINKNYYLIETVHLIDNKLNIGYVLDGEKSARNLEFEFKELQHKKDKVYVPVTQKEITK